MTAYRTHHARSTSADSSHPLEGYPAAGSGVMSAGTYSGADRGNVIFPVVWRARWQLGANASTHSVAPAGQAAMRRSGSILTQDPRRVAADWGAK